MSEKSPPSRSSTPVVTRRGLMLVLSSPSGAGKSTISRALLEREAQLTMSVSATTRAPRPGEEEGVHYFFMNKAYFGEMVANGEFLEHAHVFDHHYGTPRGPVEAALTAGRDVLFDVDWQGTQQLAHSARADLVSIFILPPSYAELERRLYARAQDPEEVVKRRMAKAASEMSHWREYDYIIVNEDIEVSVNQVQSILTGERLKRDRQVGLPEFVHELCDGKEELV
ncbi:MAG: guanylate kinase [Rhodospirillales bacterium]